MLHESTNYGAAVSGPFFPFFLLCSCSVHLAVKNIVSLSLIKKTYIYLRKKKKNDFLLEYFAAPKQVCSITRDDITPPFITASGFMRLPDRITFTLGN